MTPRQNKIRLRSYSIYWPKGWGFLIHHEDKLKFRYYSTYWAEVLAGLTPGKTKWKLRSYVMYSPEGVAGIDSKARHTEVKILFDILARGGGMFDLS